MTLFRYGWMDGLISKRTIPVMSVVNLEDHTLLTKQKNTPENMIKEQTNY